MRRLFCMMLAVCLAAGCFSALAEGETSAETGSRIPEAGEVICGFETKEVRDFPLAGGKLVLFEHQQTGAPLLWIANSDTNRVFQIGFRTRPHDDMGLPHVFEHATLFGSEKYPSSSLFFNLLYQTYNTFINAFTTDACTVFPLASLSEEQLLRLADYYVDSCFHPIIMTDESIFRTQAWHYKLPDPEGELSYEGVVYSEMTGAMTLERTALENANEAAFPGSSLSYSYGGLPEAIPEMTWEDVKNFHNLYYHPSNSFTILYGQLNNYEAFLKLLDDEFRKYERKEFPFEDSGYTRITEPVTEKIPYPMAAGTDPSNRSCVTYYILMPGLREDAEQEKVIDHLSLMLNSQSSGLQQKMKKRFPAAAFSCGREVAGPDDAMMFLATGMNEDDGEAFRELVDEAIREAAQNGFSEEEADNIMTAQRISSLLAMESGDPVSSLTQSFMYNYAVTGNPFDYQEQREALKLIAEENRTGALKEAAAKWLAGNPLYTLTTTYPAPGEKEKQDAALKEKLAAVKAGMTEAELQEIISAGAEAPKQEDTSAMMAEIKAVGAADLPEDYRRYELSDATDENGIRFVGAEAAVEGIGQPMLLLDAAALPQEDIHWMKLFTQLLGSLDTDTHTKEELDVLTGRYLYGNEFNVNILEARDNTIHPYLSVNWMALDEDLARGYELAEELLFHTQFTDTARLTEEISARKTELRSLINGASYQVMLYRGLADRYPYYRAVDYVNFLPYYSFLAELEKKAAEDPGAVAEKLREIQAFFMNRAGAIAACVGSRETLEANRTHAEAFLMKLDSREAKSAEWNLPVPEGNEALIDDGNIQYNCVIATLDDLGLEELDYGLAAVCALVTDQILMPVLRDQMGVYTPMNRVIMDKGMYLISYRDPGLRATFDVYASLADRIAELKTDQETLDGYIMSSYSALAKPQGELNGALTALNNHLKGYDQDLKLRCMRQLKTVTPETVSKAAELYRRAWESGVHSTSGSAAAINAAADLFTSVLNPFGAQDVSGMALTDLPEDHPAYGAVRFLFENRLMPADGENRIRPDEEATAGDAAAVLFAALGLGVADDPAAMDTLSQYGILPAGTAAETPLTRALYGQILSGLNAVVGQQLPFEAGEDDDQTVMTRGDLALNLAPLLGYGEQ